MKVRTIRNTLASLFLAAAMTLLPAVPAIADRVSAADGIDDKIERIMSPGTPAGFSDDIANPYGYDKGSKFLLSEHNELLFYYTFDTDSNSSGRKGNRHTAWYDKYASGGSLTLRDDKKGTVQGGFSQFGEYETTDAFAYVAATSFDPTGSGRRDHVAYVGYEHKGDRGYYLWILDTRNGKQYGPTRISKSDCNWLENANKKVDLYAGSHFFGIVAGDFDGDGKDHLILTVTNDGNYGLYDISLNGSKQIITHSWDEKGQLHPLYNKYYSQMGDTGGDWGTHKLSVSLAVGDFDGDGIDDLAVLSYPFRGNRLNDGSSVTDSLFGVPYLSLTYGKKGDAYFLNNTKTGTYVTSGPTELVFDPITLPIDHVYPHLAGIAAGDINGDGIDEIVTAGYVGISTIYEGKLAYDCWEDDKWLYGSFSGAGRKVGNIEYQKLDCNNWSKSNSGARDNVGPKVVLACAAFDGKANPESVFLSGNIYRCITDTNKLDLAEKYDKNGKVIYNSRTIGEFNNADNYAESHGLAKTYIASVAVGNFEETAEGYEQLFCVIGLETKQQKYYFYAQSAETDTRDENGITEVFKHDKGGYIYRNQPFGLDKRPNVLLVPIDRDNDGIRASYRGAAYAWSDPEVMAIIQASPYFSDVSGYLYDSPLTEYVTSVTYELETGKSNSVSFGVGLAGSLEMTIGLSFELQTGYAMDWSQTFTETLTESIEQTYTAGAYDSVVISRTPVFVYSYDVEFIDKDGKAKTDILQISVPKSPVREQLSTENYNDFVNYYNTQIKTIATANGTPASEYEKSYMTALADNLYLGSEGDPFGYYMDGVSTGINPVPVKFGNLRVLDKNASSSSTTYSYETSVGKSTEMSHGFSFDLTVQFGFDIGAVKAKAGGYVSLQYMKGNSTTVTNGIGTSFTGEVIGLDGKAMKADGIDPDAYGFNWQLAKWNSNIKTTGGKDYVPIIGYVLSSVQAPPYPVKNLELNCIKPTVGSATDRTNFRLTWENGDDPAAKRPGAAGYSVYLEDPETGKLELIKRLTGTEFEYLTYPDGRDEYRFVVKAFSKATSTYRSAESVGEEAIHYMKSQTLIIKIEKTASDGRNDTYTIFFADGTIQNFTVRNGSDGKDGNNGKDGTDGKDGVNGKDGVSITKVEKLRSENGTDIYAVYMSDGTTYTFTVKNGTDGKNGSDGRDGSDGKNGADGKDGKDGENGKDGADGENGKNGVTVVSVKIDKDGNFIFTMSDGTEVNAGLPDGVIPSGDSDAITKLKAEFDALKKENGSTQRTLVYLLIGLIISLISLILSVYALSKRRKDSEKRRES